LLLFRAGTIAIAGNLGGLQVANTGSGTIFTSGVAYGAAAAVSGSGKSVLIPVSGKQLPFLLPFLPFLPVLPFVLYPLERV